MEHKLRDFDRYHLVERVREAIYLKLLRAIAEGDYGHDEPSSFGAVYSRGSEYLHRVELVLE